MSSFVLNALARADKFRNGVDGIPLMIAAKERPGDLTQAGHHLLAVAFCTLLLILPALLNRAPFLYFDSGAYLNQADKAVRMLRGQLGLLVVGESDAILAGVSGPATDAASDDSIIAGRSIYYSFIAWTGAATLGLGAIVALQSLILSVLIVMAVHTIWPGAPPAARLIATLTLSGGLAFLTSAGFFVSLVLPDIWAGIMILAFALLIANGPHLGRASCAALGAVLAFAALVHTSHLLLLATLAGLLAIAMLHPPMRRIVAPRCLVVPASALAFGLAGHAAFSLVVTGVTGQPPLTMPLVTAHLVDMGPGTRLAQETCPDSGFAICPYVDRLPADWIAFVFSRDPRTGVFGTVPRSVQRALSEEQVSFALAALAAEPLAMTGGLLRDGIAQLWHLSVDDVPLTAKNETFLAENFTQEVAATIRGSAIWNRPWAAPALSRLIQVGTGFAVAGLFVLALSRRLPRRGPLATLLLICVIGLVLNALICGILASPYGRFQARVAWLLPFLLALTVMTVRFPAFAFPKEASHDNI